MVWVIISILVFTVAVSGIILSLSYMLNTYQQRKIEYISYRNSVMKKNKDGTEDIILSETQYYNRNLPELLPGSSNNSRFLDIDTYTDFVKNTSGKVIDTAKNTDYSQIIDNTKISAGKTFNFLKRKILDSYKFIIQLSKPLDPSVEGTEEQKKALPSKSKTFEKEKSWSRNSGRPPEKLSLAERKRILNGDEVNISRFKKEEEAQNAIATNVKTQDYFETRTNSKIKTENKKTYSESNNSHDELYEKLESEIMAKLEKNMSDFELWESLGDFYRENNELAKSKEIYNYIQDHCNTASIKIRVRKKS